MVTDKVSDDPMRDDGKAGIHVGTVPIIIGLTDLSTGTECKVNWNRVNSPKDINSLTLQLRFISFLELGCYVVADVKRR